MKKQFDYDIFVKRVNMEETPEDMVIRLQCGVNEFVIPTTRVSNYQFSSSVQCKNCKPNEDITFTLSFLDQRTGEMKYLSASFPYKQFCMQANFYDQWITLYYKDTNMIAGALLLSLVSRIAQYELYNKNISDYYPEPYAHRPKELRRVSVESRPSASNLGSFGSYYM